MEKKKIIQFANENPVCFLGTIQDDKPHVRAVMLWYADESGFYFETLAPKDMSKQLHKNQNVEICFYNQPSELMDATEMRLSGKIEFIEEQDLIDKAYEERKFLEDLAGVPIKKHLEVFRLSHGDAHFWNIKTDVMKEPELEHLAF